MHQHCFAWLLCRSGSLVLSPNRVATRRAPQSSSRGKRTSTILMLLRQWGCRAGADGVCMCVCVLCSHDGMTQIGTGSRGWHMPPTFPCGRSAGFVSRTQLRPPKKAQLVARPRSVVLVAQKPGPPSPRRFAARPRPATFRLYNAAPAALPRQIQSPRRGSVCARLRRSFLHLARLCLRLYAIRAGSALGLLAR